MEYLPSPSVTTARVFSIRTGLDASTVTPGSTAPDVSFTTPAIVLCAAAMEGKSVRNARPTQRRADVSPFIGFSLPCRKGMRTPADGFAGILIGNRARRLGISQGLIGGSKRT